MRKSPTLLGTNTPFVQAVHVGEKQRPTAILLRTSWTTSRKGAANGIAQAWHNPNNRLDSCHYVVDDFQTLRCVPDNLRAFHSPSNHKGVVSINVCHDPPAPPTQEVIARVAYLTARLCKLHHIPVHILDLEAECRWIRHKWRSRGGILVKTRGEFPVDKFMASVESNYRTF